MSTAKNLKVNPEKEEDKFRTSDINLKAELLRIQTISCSKQINRIWYLDETGIIDFFQTYSPLPQSKIRPGALFQMGGTRMIKNQNKIYLGQVKNKQKHGVGIIVYRDGRIYEGQFVQNEKSGAGCELYANGNLYIGAFSQNKKHGKGSFYWYSLCAPACTKQAGMNIQQYHGSWWGGLPDGAGEHQKVNGDYYVGGFKNGLKHGEGIQYYANKDFYKGEYVNGLPEGYGEYKWADGSIYKGDFKQGYRNGYGIWQSKNALQQYKGHYLLDRKHGYGIYDWGNGTVYKGNYIEDVRNGFGELFQNDQKVYEGEWENGEQAKFNQQIAPPKSKQYELGLKKNMNSTTAGTMHSGSFRVKTAKHVSRVVANNRKLSAVETKKDNFQVNFRLVDSKSSHHRNCQACCRRASTVASSHKLRRGQKYLNPEMVF